MRRAILVSVLALACTTPTWKRHPLGAPLPQDKVILVGSFTTVPTIQQRGNRAPGGGTWVGGRYEPAGHVVFVGEQAGHVAALFTPDLSEPWQQDTLTVPFSRYDWAWFPMDGAFVVEVPRREHLYLRGIFYVTDGGGVRVELPAQLDLRPDDRVVYVGEIRVVRSGDRRTLFNDRQVEARKAALEAGYQDLLAVPWRTRLFRPLRTEADSRTAARAAP